MSSLVSICIPTFNGEAFLQEALDSINDQTYKNIEVIISDDNSQDDTLNILKAYKKKVTIPVKILYHIPSGIGANWNNCIKNANGTFIKFLFQDDILYPDCISEMVKVFNEHKNLGLVASKREFIINEELNAQTKQWVDKYKNLQVQFEKKNTKLTVIDNSLFKASFFFQSPLNKIGEPTATLFKKEMLRKIGLFDIKMQQILDYVFYYKILKNHKIAIINKPLVGFRLHSEQATNINRKRKIPDYELYDHLLYKQFFNLLDVEHKQRLKKRYNIYYKVYNICKRKLKFINKIIFNG